DIASTAKAKGVLKAIEAVGTAPFGFPVGGRATVLRLVYENGDDYYRFGWDKALDRIINMGAGTKLLGSTPLRAAPGGGVVGWNIVTGRSLAIAKSGVGSATSIEVRTTDGLTSTAQRVT